MTISTSRLNSAMWAACNVKHPSNCIPSMEKATEIGLAAVAAYLGIQDGDPEWEEWLAAVEEASETEAA